MKVDLDCVRDSNDDYRMAIHHQWGEHGTLASRDEVKSYAWLVGASNDEDILKEWQDCEECRKGDE